jgi:hypothetical protein
MSKPDNFIFTSDFPTIKNDGVSSTTVTLPGSVSVAGNGSVTYTSDITVGSIGGIINGRIASSKNSTDWYAGQVQIVTRTGKVGGVDALYGVVAFMYRLNSTTVRCVAHILNPYSSTLTGATGNEIFYFYVSTYLSPFS